MKQLATIGVVVLLLLGAAIYFSQNKKTTTTTTPDPVTPIPDPDPIVNNDGTPVTHGQVDGTLVLKSAISNGYLLQGGLRELYAAIDIEAIKYDGGTRPPLNVSVVIDRSGSMSGDKIVNVKAAARRLVNVLNENDRIAIVSYGSDVSVDFASRPVTAQNRVELLRAIDNIDIGGGTNLSGGFRSGYSQITKYKTADSVNRVILMSDGHANIGITDVTSLIRLSTNALKERVSVTSIGVGLDYNENLMTQMANEGAGNYYFVDRSQQVISFLDQELKGLASTVAKNASVVVELEDGVALEQLYGYPHQRSGNKVYISLSEFYSEQKKNVLMKLNATASVPGDKPVFKVSLSYDDAAKKKPSLQELKLASVVTTDASKLQAANNIDVIARVQQVEIANNMNQALELYDKGKAGEAQKIITKTQTSLRNRQKTFKFKDNKKYDKAWDELDSLNDTLGSVPARSAEGKRVTKKKKARSNAIILNEASF